jgi:hypothetical protein
MTDSSIAADIISMIREGDVDDHLSHIAQAVAARRVLKDGQRRVPENFYGATRVKVIGKLKPNYLLGHDFEVKKINPKTVVVSVPNELQYGKFAGMTHVRIPKGALEIVA